MSMKLPPIREKDFMAQVVQLGNLHGWRSYHTYDSRKSAPGFPDLFMIRGPRAIVAELKRDGKQKLTAHQEAWLQLFRGVPGVEAYHWTPGDWEEIERVLA
jgi:hypothetical protein